MDVAWTSLRSIPPPAHHKDCEPDLGVACAFTLPEVCGFGLLMAEQPNFNLHDVVSIGSEDRTRGLAGTVRRAVSMETLKSGYRGEVGYMKPGKTIQHNTMLYISASLLEMAFCRLYFLSFVCHVGCLLGVRRTLTMAMLAFQGE